LERPDTLKRTRRDRASSFQSSCSAGGSKLLEKQGWVRLSSQRSAETPYGFKFGHPSAQKGGCQNLSVPGEEELVD